MGDARFIRLYEELAAAPDALRHIRTFTDEAIIGALAGASASRDAYLANVLATEAMNRVARHRRDALTVSTDVHEIAPATAPPADEAVYARQTLLARHLGVGKLIEWIPDAVIIADEDGRIRVWNDAATRIFGYDAAEAEHLNVRDLVPHELRARHDEGMEQFRETGHGAFIDAHTVLDLPALRKDGSEILIEMVLARVDAEDMPPHALAIVTDVTARVRLERQVARERDRLADANRHLVETNRVLESFTYAVSHDLREPVRAMEALLRALHDDIPELEPTDARVLLERALAANDRLARTLTDLLETSRTRTNDLAVDTVDLVELIAEPDARMSYERHLHGRTGRLEVAPDLPRVRAPRALLTQVMRNLLGNAVKHNPRDDPVVRVRPVDDETEDLATVIVEDNGPGLPPDVLESLHDDAHTAVTGRRGFGLLIAKGGVERLGGRFTVGESALGGAAFLLALPRGP